MSSEDLYREFHERARFTWGKSLDRLFDLLVAVVCHRRGRSVSPKTPPSNE